VRLASDKGPVPLDRQAFTLLEVLVSVALLIIVASVLVYSGNAVRQSRMRGTAQQQMAMIATAIEEYTAFWPRWQVVDGTQTVVVADKGWPDFIPGRLFTPDTAGGVFQTVAGFNDRLDFDVTRISFDRGRQSFDDPSDWTLPGHVLDANACLAYCLTAASGKGPYISDKKGANLKDLGAIHKQSSVAFYPPYAGTSAAQRREVFVDPWGTPYRYFWVYRDAESDSNLRAYKGVLPVDYGPYFASPIGDYGSVNNVNFKKNGVPKTATGFVLESAGPDRLFGNVWKANPSNDEIQQARDNLTTMP
jgi:type II secretory pathway pseudopilin PulG